ncbi:hypothetical protein P389DRAFT_146071, partial [Cystobasidium minutum MCA 4210]|uniref:uncharacterized protein n=1 Tax=Cystobasidium minutum MCA 4210 TaxID=1397322 RepID=UPI0034CE2F3A
YKTEMCRSWSEIGSCRYAEKCQFAHGMEELRPMPSHYLHPHNNYHHQQGYGSVRNGTQTHLARSTPSSSQHYTAHTRGYSYPNTQGHAQTPAATPAYTSIVNRGTNPAFKTYPFGNDLLVNGTRRRSVSSPSKVRMYSLARGDENRESDPVWQDNGLHSDVSLANYIDCSSSPDN